MVIPKMVGRVASVRVKVGDTVPADEVLFALETTDIERQVEQSRIALQGAQANLALSQSQSSLAKASLERTRGLIGDKIAHSRTSFERNLALYEAGALSLVQFQQAEMMHKEEIAVLQNQLEQAELAASDGSLRVVEISVQQAQLAYRQALDALSNAVIRAPINGTVATVNVQTAEFASTAQPAVVLVNIDPVKIQVDVSQSLINKLYRGKEVTVRVVAADGDIRAGIIDTVSPVPNAQTGLYPISILLENQEQAIKPGMFAEVTVSTDHREDAMVIDSRAVVERGGQQWVFVAEGDRARAVKVVTGIQSGTEIEIKEGLTGDMEIIVRGQHYVQDGSLIEVVRGR
jgi:multidrug efflux pump subunit AcrA (membrane-fusion protein)